MDRNGFKRRMDSVVSRYKNLCVVVSSTVLIFIFINIVLSVLFSIKDEYCLAEYLPQGSDPGGAVYPGLSRQDRVELNRETWDRHLEFEPFTGFRERPRIGKWVNVHEGGFRDGGSESAWPPDARLTSIFVFGGSTTFGYGPPDDQTIPAQLGRILRDRSGVVKVYNFGRGYFFSTQERILLEQLIVNSTPPKIAIFIDGMNDFYNAKRTIMFQDAFARSVDLDGSAERSWLPDLPIHRLAAAARRRWGTQRPYPDPSINYDDPPAIAGVIERYRQNKRMIEVIARAYGITPVFVWQPAPTYKYDLKYHIFGHDLVDYPKYGYPAMARLVAEGAMGDDFLWLADIQEDSKEPLYVDRWHYTARFSGEIARHLADFLLERKLLGVAVRTGDGDVRLQSGG